MSISYIIKRIFHPEDWLLDKDIHDLENEIEMIERQLPAYKQKLRMLKEKKYTKYKK